MAYWSSWARSPYVSELELRLPGPMGARITLVNNLGTLVASEHLTSHPPRMPSRGVPRPTQHEPRGPAHSLPGAVGRGGEQLVVRVVMGSSWEGGKQQ